MPMIRVVPVLVLAGALLRAGAAPAQVGPCSAPPGPLAHALMAARPPAALAPAQRALYAAAVAALRRGDRSEAARQLVALARTKPGLARPDSRCALIYAAVRQGALEPDRGRSSRVDQLARAWDQLQVVQARPSGRVAPGQRPDNPAIRDEVESKYKASEQSGQSDYQILVTIVKTMDEELGSFDKSMM